MNKHVNNSLIAAILWCLAFTQTPPVKACDAYYRQLVDSELPLLRNLNEPERAALYAASNKLAETRLLDLLEEGELPTPTNSLWSVMPHLALRLYVEDKISLNEVTAVALYWQTAITVENYSSRPLERKEIVDENGEITEFGRLLVGYSSIFRRALLEDQMESFANAISQSPDNVDRFVHIGPVDQLQFPMYERTEMVVPRALAPFAALGRLVGTELLLEPLVNNLLETTEHKGGAFIVPTLNQLQCFSDAFAGKPTLRLNPELGLASRDSILRQLHNYQRPLGIFLPGTRPESLEADGVEMVMPLFTAHDGFHAAGADTPEYTALMARIGTVSQRLSHFVGEIDKLPLSIRWKRWLEYFTHRLQGRYPSMLDKKVGELIDLHYQSLSGYKRSEVLAEKLAFDFGTYDVQASARSGPPGLIILHMVADPAAYKDFGISVDELARQMGPRTEAAYRELKDDPDAKACLKELMGISY